MRLEPTPALTIALQRAMRLALDQGLTALEPTHLLVGLLAEEEGHCVVLLRQAGLDWSAWGERLNQAATQIARHEMPTEGEVCIAAAVRHILNLAREEPSSITEEGSLASDQVLLAILAHCDDLRRQVESCGLDYAALMRSQAKDTAPLVLDTPLLFEDPREPIDAARVVDACANRAREALRVLEDHARFVLNDSFLSAGLKELRHGLALALGEVPALQLLQARDTPHDVGTSITTAQEQVRDSLNDVLQANAKRLQESLRSLEEFGKVLSPALGKAMETLRYRAYTLEKALVLSCTAQQRLADARLYVLVTDSLCRASLEGTVREAVDGGADVIQLREKELEDRALLERARMVRQLTRRFGALFIMNDRLDLAILAEADGVHLGQDDLPLQEARRLLGPDALIGVSTHNEDQLKRAILEGASYVGVGPTFPSSTKSFRAFAGLELVRLAAATTKLPAFALGGITLENVGQVTAAGLRRIAVSQAVCAADDPRAVARALRRALAEPVESA